jgi:hypothetical protein
MSFRLKSDASPADGLHRLVRKQFDIALAALATRTPDEEAVRAARTSVKKIRAVMRLLQDHLGSAGRRETRRLRVAAHALASLRDADATAETLQALRGRYPTVLNRRVTGAVARGLRARKRRTRKGAGMLARHAQAQLRRSRRSVPGRVRRAGELDAVRSGLTRAYRRARKELSGLSPDSDATRFHTWRRRVKDHALQMRLFGRLHEAARARARSLDRLGGWLGEDHNLAMLRATLLASPDAFGAASDTAAVLGSIAKRQAHLRGNALRLGRGLFSAKPRSFRKRVGGWLPRGTRR